MDINRAARDVDIIRVRRRRRRGRLMGTNLSKAAAGRQNNIIYLKSLYTPEFLAERCFIEFRSDFHLVGGVSSRLGEFRASGLAQKRF